MEQPPDESTKIRPARRDDLDVICALHLHAWKVGYAGILPRNRLDQMNASIMRQRWEEVLDSDPDSGCCALAAEISGNVVGVIRMAEIDQDLELAYHYISPAYQGRGIGTSLLGEAMRIGAASGHHRCLLWVVANHAYGRKFYERRGWTLTGNSTERIGPDWSVFEVQYERVFVTS